MNRVEKALLSASHRAARETALASLKAQILLIYPQTKSIPQTARLLNISERQLHRLLAKFPDLKKDAQAERARGVDGRPKRERKHPNQVVKSQPKGRAS